MDLLNLLKKQLIKNIRSSKMKKIEEIIKEPVHRNKFYTKRNIMLLKRKVNEIYNFLKIEKLDNSNIIEKIVEFIKSNVVYKKSYFDCFIGKVNKFDYNNVKYRTAYSALVEGEAMCAGYAEALRILLSMYNIESYTILSKLPLERKKLLHYVVIVKLYDSNQEYKILDPESEQYCEKNKIDYNTYKEKSIYIIPDEVFTNNILGKDGAGILAEEYLKDNNVRRITGTKNINELMKNIK